MKKLLAKKLATLFICSSIATSYAIAEESAATSADNKLYFAIDGGYSIPAKHKFKDKDASGNVVVGKLKGTEVYEGKVGYKFYPNLAVEIAYAYRPKYKLSIFPADKPNKFGPGLGLTNIYSQTNVQSHTLMLNLLYEAQTEKNYRPYFMFGLGYAHVTPKAAPIYATIPTLVAVNPAGGFNGNTRPQIGNIKKFTSERMGWRVGTGLIYDLTPNFSLVGGVKLEVIQNIGLHTQFTDGSTQSLKKTIGVVDLTIGTRISL